MRPPTSAQVEKATRICIETCGAKESVFDGIEFHLGDLTEWRFQGDLGFGGKLYWDGRRFRVDCYPEDATPRRKQMVDKANARLAGEANLVQ